MLNDVKIMGRLTRDVELRRTNSGKAVASFSIACDRDFGEKETDFIDCAAWKQTAEFISKYFKKGSMIVVSGRLQVRTWNDKDGSKRRQTEVVVDKAYFGDSKKESGDSGFAPNNSFPNNYAVMEGDDAELPF